jgi:hypothetical protein
MLMLPAVSSSLFALLLLVRALGEVEDDDGLVEVDDNNDDDEEDVLAVVLEL